MLGRHWEPGEGTIIASEGNYLFLGGTGCSSREYVVDVQPAAGGPMFRTKINVQYTAPEDSAQNPYRRLLDGEVVPVRCDQKRQKAKFDESALRGAESTSGASGPSQFEAAASAPPGTPPQPPGAAKPTAAGWEAVSQDGNPGDPVHAEFRVVTDPAKVSSAASSAAGADPLERLQKLADLHDRGVLTDAEFAAEKAKLFGDS